MNKKRRNYPELLSRDRSTFSVVTTKDTQMFYLVIMESGRIAGLFTSPVDSHLRLKALGGVGRVVRMRANEDFNDTWTGSHDRADAPTPFDHSLK